MDRDDFIITIYCLVCVHYQVWCAEHPLWQGGFGPQLTDEEVIKLEIYEGQAMWICLDAEPTVFQLSCSIGRHSAQQKKKKIDLHALSMLHC